ncbi:outer membrane protein [Rhizobium sp. SSA_523]|uniref:outer membrane protein n=1 Tax=Rhizobium sp. SSA_523 TaxID=2952477 RepID=UPI002091D832|nr:outer membrane protein [Rhizobium sp. SSA_523]MCO5730940.1 porin family protein [Rhizobium sp. SSA_523]WKC24248.1 porin family protein [Rhizobium sp. SSA_523]
MKKILLLATGVALISSSAAFAADAVYEVPEAPVAQEVVVPTFSWTGGYVGIHGGYGWADGDFSTAATGTLSDDFDGGRLGGFVGYNWQLSGGFLVGIEGDVNYDWNDNDYFGGYNVDTGFSGSVRGRVGYAMDRALLFAAGGWTATNASIEGPGIDSSETMHGWTVGGGVDWAFTDKVFGRVEYRYNDYGDKNIGPVNAEFDQHVVNVGVAVKF